MCVRLGNEDLDKDGDKCRYSVTEQQLCRRLHIPGFRRQCHYYCILGEKQHDSQSQWKSASKRNRKKKTILLTFSNPMAQSLSILNVYSRLETGAPA